MNFEKLDLQEAIESYQRRETRPTELIESYLKAIEAKKELGAFLEVKTDEVLNRARDLELRSKDLSKLPLYGIPIAIKDNFLVKGWKTTAGSKILSNYVAPYTATSVERLESNGAIVIGKTNLDEFAMGSSCENSSFGECKNPWDLLRVPGGSSGGSAVAVSANLALGSLGTDTGGSIRQPASLCGVVGVKPTYGRVSRYGVVAFSSSLDQVGPFSHTVWGSARLLEVMSGYDRRDATSSRGVVPRYTEELKDTSVKNISIGVAKDWLEGAHEDVLKSFKEVLRILETEGAKIVDISLPHVKYALSTYYLIAPSEASSNLARYDGIRYGYRTKEPKNGEELYSRSRGEGFGAEVKLRIMLGTYALSAGYYDAYYIKANQVRRLIQRDFDDALNKCHCILAPTSPTTAFKIGEKSSDPISMYLSDIYTLPANLAGLPAISIPCGTDSLNLPIGVQIIGRSFDESTLFRVGHHYERLRGAFLSPTALSGEGNDITDGVEK